LGAWNFFGEVMPICQFAMALISYRDGDLLVQLVVEVLADVVDQDLALFQVDVLVGAGTDLADHLHHDPQLVLRELLHLQAELVLLVEAERVAVDEILVHQVAFLVLEAALIFY